VSNRDEEDDLPEGRTDAEYRVGDKKPPLHTRFKPGVSGNPKGRSKRSADDPSMTETVNRKISVTDSRGNRRAATMLKVMNDAAAIKAAKGDLKALNLVYRELERERARVTSNPAATAARPWATDKPRRTFQEIMWDFEADMRQEAYLTLCDVQDKFVAAGKCEDEASKVIFMKYLEQRRQNDVDFRICLLMVIGNMLFKKMFETTLSRLDDKLEYILKSGDESDLGTHNV